ncbi:MAG: hypothetical protein ACE15E_14800 [Acidobacteriota bacterium]
MTNTSLAQSYRLKARIKVLEVLVEEGAYSTSSIKSEFSVTVVAMIRA